MCPRISIKGFVHPSVGPLVRWSVGLSVRWSVRNPFLINCGNEDLKTIKHQGTHRIAFLVEIQENSAEFKKIQENSAKFKKIQQFIGRIVVRIELVSSCLLPLFSFFC